MVDMIDSREGGRVPLRRTGAYYPKWINDDITDLVEKRIFKDVREDRVHFEVTINDGKPGMGKTVKNNHWVNRANEIYKKDVNIHLLSKVQHMFYLFNDQPVQFFIVDDVFGHVFTRELISNIMTVRHAYEKSDPKYFDLPHKPNSECNIIMLLSIQNMFGIDPSIRRIGTSYDFNSLPGVKKHKVDLANDFITHQGLQLLNDISEEIDQFDVDSSRGKSIFSGLTYAGLYFNPFVKKKINVTVVSEEIDQMSDRLLKK